MTNKMLFAIFHQDLSAEKFSTLYRQRMRPDRNFSEKFSKNTQPFSDFCDYIGEREIQSEGLSLLTHPRRNSTGRQDQWGERVIDSFPPPCFHNSTGRQGKFNERVIDFPPRPVLSYKHRAPPFIAKGEADRTSQGTSSTSPFVTIKQTIEKHRAGPARHLTIGGSATRISHTPRCKQEHFSARRYYFEEKQENQELFCKL